MLSDNDIQGLIEDVKPLSSKSVREIIPTARNGKRHKGYELEIISQLDRKYIIRVRVNTINAFDFSVILMYHQQEDGKRYILRRYNGNSHSHKNQIEKDRLRGFHIHLATERYQKAGYNIEGYAEPTNSYTNWQDALTRMINDCNFQLDVPLLSNFGRL